MRKITITEKILKRPVTVFMLSLMVVGFGLFSLTNLRVTLMPEFNIPVLAVSVNYSNVAPEDMSRLVVEPIEGAIMGVEGIDELESNVRRGGAFIILRLKPGVHIQSTEMKVREAMDRIRAQLPSEANEPVIFQFDPDSAPIVQFSVESSVLGLDDLRQLSVEFIEPRFERLPGVASAETQGGLERNFFVSLDPYALSRHRVMPSEVLSALRNNNVNQPIGNLTTDRISYSVRAEAIFKSLEEIEQTVIRQNDEGIPVRVSDVANVENTFADISSVEEVNGKNSVTVQVQKQSDANTLDVAQSAVAEMNRMASLLPSSVTMQVLSNEGDFIANSINNLAQSALIALTVVVIILLIFMGGWRIAFVVAMSIPVSLTATFAAMYFAGITLNIISITGLALAIGLLVDNSIVVTESIAYKMVQGHGRFRAALDGTNEVGGALLGSTLTTLAVFIPILGVTGVTGTVTRDLALTISIAITSSFLASIILIPVLASIVMKPGQFDNRNFMFRLIGKVEKNYGKILFWILRRKYVVMLFVVAIIFGSFYFFRTIPGEFFPESDTGEFDVRVDLPAGTQLPATAELLRGYTDELLEMPEIRTVITSIGRQRWSRQSNVGQLNVLLVDQRERSRSTDEVMEEVESRFDDPGVDLEFSIAGSGPGGMRGGRWGEGRGVQLTLYGSDMQVLRDISYRIEDRMLQEPEVMSVSNPRTRPGPEFEFHPDRERIARLDVPTSQIASAFGTQSRGSRAGYFREDGREIPIEVRNDRKTFQNRSDMFSLELLQVDDVRMPITSLGNFELTESMQRLSRRDREVVLDLNIMTRENPEAYRSVIADIISDDIVLPDGYRYDFSGRMRMQDDSAREMGIAFLFALLLTYMVMASLFENFRDPFIIMFTVPLAFFGSLVFLFMTNTALSVPAYIGIVILVGIVVNNGIVLVDFIHQKTARGLDHRGKLTDEESESGASSKAVLNADRVYLVAFLQACKRRMRPILLTAMTTIFSMIPLALEVGVGSETWSPLAKSVIGGLAFATILTLFVVPAIVIGISKNRRELFRKGLAVPMPGGRQD
ncbi:efflux RND transporter permease subunit [Natronogracilivirga saccharolytica]|uniref:Efflux RND transporter permease subunit n=1 Tax=Natronogracilivirga saccharolytica TaxID=2812953 RepID=A0A8J7RTI4_9BACT|nr:efflux RND transporter permease subunit [Natronogracilivirga saccharolytica]MBP3192702.1 efflux RND transporter permease subunit [Natronogracilivirga saccharolytica]